MYGDDYVEEVEEDAEEEENPTWTEVMCDVRYRRATWIASLMAILQQFSGVNAITFYSGAIFTDAKLNPNVGAAACNTVSWFAVLGAALLLNRVGRKTLLVVFFFVLSVFSILQSVFTITGHNTLEMTDMFFYMIAFQLGPGPVVWLYMAEICNEKSINIATFFSWLGTLIISLTTNLLFDKLTKDYTFAMFGVFNIFSGLICLVVLKETKGKTYSERMKLFRPAGSST